jgi:hypothetical protein
MRFLVLRRLKRPGEHQYALIASGHKKDLRAAMALAEHTAIRLGQL